MNGFIDIHTHILPAVDDGARDILEARKMVECAWKSGTRTLFLTPHYRGSFRENTPAWLRESFDVFRKSIQAEFPDMRLCLGSEVYDEAEAPEKLLHGEILTLHDSDYVLVEYGPGVLRSQVVRSLDALTHCGYIPVLAHVERYHCFRKDRALPFEARHMGALFQLNADSVLGSRGIGTKRFCHQLLKDRMVDFIASDAHNGKERPPLLGPCWEAIRKKYGEPYAAALFYENAQAVIENRMI